MMYTYLIGWRKFDRWYYGSRVANKLPPENDFWKIYFTSSPAVKQFRTLHGEPDVIRIHKVFSNKEQTIDYEYRFIKKVDGVCSDRWFNKAYPGHIPGGTPAQIAAIKGKKQSAETCEKRSVKLSGAGNPMYGKFGADSPRYGKTLTPEQVEKLKAGQNAHYAIYGRPERKPLTSQQRRNVGDGKRGKPWSQKQRDAYNKRMLDF
jgi:hypothetical protein